MGIKNTFLHQQDTLVAFALSLLALAEIVDLTIVSVALPDIMGALSANITEVSLLFTSYIVAAAVFIPLTGLVTAKFGVKFVTIWSVLLFGVSSMLCGIATSVPEMVTYRLLQGIGGAFLPALAQGFIVNNFQNEARARMMMMFSMCVVMGPIIGPIVGGLITEHISWRWIFYVNVPICLFGLAIIYVFMHETKIVEQKIDYISLIFMILGIGCFEYCLDEGASDNWFDSHLIVIALVTSILSMGFFIWRGILGKSVVNFNLFRYRNYVLSCVVVFLLMAVIVGVFTFFPTLLQQGYGYSTADAAYIAAPRGIACFISAPIFAMLGKKFDARILMTVGVLVLILSAYLLTQISVVHNLSFIILICVLQGVAMMGVFVNIMQLAYVNFPASLNNDASGVFNFFRNLGSSIGTSIASTVLSTCSQVSWHDLAANISLQSSNYINWSYLLPFGQSIVLAEQYVMQQVFFISNLDVFYMSLVGMLLIIWIPFVLDKANNHTSSHDIHL